jgi:hypothetical protein
MYAKIRSFSVSSIVESKSVQWNILPANQLPTASLFNYGLEKTESGKLVLFGGLTEESEKK